MKITRLSALALISAMLFTTASAAPKVKKDKKQATPSIKLTTANDSLSYAAGMTATQGLLPYLGQQFGITDENLADFIEGFKEAVANGGDKKQLARATGYQIADMAKKQILPSIKHSLGDDSNLSESLWFKGFTDAIANDSTVLTLTRATEYFEGKQADIKAKNNAQHKAQNEAWLVENAKKEGVKTTASGLQYKVITEGTGAQPKKEDQVVVKYEGKLIDGKVFDSSYQRGDGTAMFRPTQVIKGWTEALQMMKEGSKWELYIPQNLAYGERGAGADIKPFSTLIFTVELVKVNPAEPAAEEKKIEEKKVEEKKPRKPAIAPKRRPKK